MNSEDYKNLDPDFKDTFDNLFKSREVTPDQLTEEKIIKIRLFERRKENLKPRNKV